jgi:hypothetical protein
VVRHHLHGIAHRGQVVDRIPFEQQREVIEQLFLLLVIQIQLQLVDTVGQDVRQRRPVEELH